jgi:hypothetical protein
MNPERRDFLNLHSPPGRSSTDEAAWKLGFEPDHITILVNEGMLDPLGNPPPGSMKFFFTADIEEKKNDRKWMNKATERIRLKIKDKNERAAESRALKGFPKSSPKGSVSATNGKAANGNNSHERHS